MVARLARLLSLLVSLLVKGLALATLFGALVQLAGCATALSEETLRLVAPGISLPDAHAHPKRYLGQVIPVAGTILRTQNRPDGTLLEVLGYPITRRGFPDTSEPAIGRFAVLHPGYLDSLIYRPGRWLACAGRLTGQVPSADDPMRLLPLIQPLELTLLPETTEDYPPFHISVGVMFGF